MKRKIITTGDGSKTIQIQDWNEQYHSVHGAVQEAYHVFIDHGLNCFTNSDIAILEIGFGTGLNALITWIMSERLNLDVTYTGVEAYPVSSEEIQELDYISRLEAESHSNGFEKMHASNWEETVHISKKFKLLKQQKDFLRIADENRFDLIYFDAFGARVQPELWTAVIFEKMFNALKKGGILVTYSAKGSVRRAMQCVGFTVERLPGPPGKREMLRARKI
ncbi:tRNA (5-methylaminomethyl-2-thiouridine)(34)-methyltransferase MnmD [Costertonia aggregata]|uniref:tRNA (5-methylaminomethyl-2-thiouridine)(34)-methyltransferase MnmD n=1 Tax=Costertonia aggregata TaxID=343403 RepID=A0A7H9ASC7_9FLAO|nr:tRNA (5-methylaminomethyl-2-thiouridine)(34)-methyltransferase MnmD [Costertonia aggregata]QLG46252.1 tRNA (5-methylaminomethyl-2-thiouridine)(34)-methyltransferase MnmD [Costertonia aggregata]